MNIVIFASVDFPEGDATSSRVRLLARVMREGGNRVSLAILSPNSKTPILRNNALEGEFESIRFRYLNGSTVRPSGLGSALLDTARGICRAVLYLLAKIRDREVDVIVFYTPDMILASPLIALAKLAGIQMILELCEINSTSLKPGIKGQLKRWAALATERIMPRLCDGVFAISSTIIDYLTQRGIAAGKILHLPVLVEFQRFSQPSEAVIADLQCCRYFLHSGTLEEKDGVEYLVKAFATVAASHKDICLVFTGKHPEARKAAIAALADNNEEVCRRIRFAGFLEEERLIWAYQHAEALICCRSKSRYAQFGFPTKLAEYLATGRPVITNEVGDTHRYLRQMENAILTKAEDVASIAAAMKLVLADPAPALLVGMRGQAVARENFDFSNHVGRVQKFTEILVGAVRASCVADGPG